MNALPDLKNGLQRFHSPSSYPSTSKDREAPFSATEFMPACPTTEKPSELIICIIRHSGEYQDPLLETIRAIAASCSGLCWVDVYH